MITYTPDYVGLSIHVCYSDTLPVYLEVETNNLVAAGCTTEAFQYHLRALQYIFKIVGVDGCPHIPETVL